MMMKPSVWQMQQTLYVGTCSNWELPLQALWIWTLREDLYPIPCMLALVGMIIRGPNIKSQGHGDASQAIASIAQLLQYNTTARQWPGVNRNCYIKAGETPLPIYARLTEVCMGYMEGI